MVDKQKILSRYGSQSARSVAREFGVNRKTVERYFKAYEQALQSGDSDVVDDYLSLKPTYKVGSRPRRVITETIKRKILECLKINKDHKENHMHKQCMDKMGIYEHLINQGFELSYSTVCKL